MRRALPFLLVVLAARADAGQILTFTEEGTKDGQVYRSSLRLGVSADAVRAEATDLTSPGAPKTVVYLYLAKDDRIVPVDPPIGPVVSAGTIAVVEERAHAAGHRRGPGAVAVTPLHSTQAFGTWTCDAWALEGGVPVRTFRSREGVVELDAQLVAVEDADLPADLFRAPAPTAPAAAPVPTRAPDRTITLEGWALRGMPDAERPWTGADYAAAAGLLETVAKEDAASCRATRARTPVRSSGGSSIPKTSSLCAAPAPSKRARRRARGSSRGSTGSASSGRARTAATRPRPRRARQAGPEGGLTVRPRWPLPLLALCAAGALGSFALHAAWVLRRPPAPLGVPVALELGIALVWFPAVAAFALRARARFGSPFSPALVRDFFPTFFDGTPPWLRRAAAVSVAYAFLFLASRWVWQLNDPDASWPSPGDPELTVISLAFYVLSAAVLAGAGKERGPGPRAL